jgi:hypothetical protein
MAKFNLSKLYHALRRESHRRRDEKVIDRRTVESIPEELVEDKKVKKEKKTR